MALNAGDMLYYDGTKWVNSSTIAIATTGLTLQLSDAGTANVVYAAQLKHVTSAPGSIGTGFGVGVDFVGMDTGGGTETIGAIACAQSNAAAGSIASFHSFYEYAGGSRVETVRLGSEGGSVAAAFFGVSLLGNNVPFQLNHLVRNLGGGSGNINLASGETQSPILEFTNAGAAATVIFPSATDGGFWIIYNNSGQTLTISPGGNTIATGKRAIYYADGVNIRQVTPPT